MGSTLFSRSPMLKLKLATLEGLSADMAKEYKANAAGDGFVLDTDVPFEDTTALKNALVQEKAHRKTATESVTALTTKVADLEAAKGGVTEIEKSWQAKLTAAESAAKVKTDTLTKQLHEQLVDNVANQMASEISTAPSLLAPVIRGRLSVQEEEGKLVTRVMTPDGKLSATSVNELKSEILADKQFAPILTASRASGGGANGNQHHGTPAGGKDFSKMNEAEKTTLFKTNRPEFDRLRALASTAPVAAATVA